MSMSKRIAMTHTVRRPIVVVAASLLAATVTASCAGERTVPSPDTLSTSALAVSEQAIDTTKNQVAATARTTASRIAAAAPELPPTHRFPVMLPTGQTEEIDVRPCVRVVGDGPYPRAGLPYRPQSASHACAAAVLRLLEVGATNPRQALSLLAQTAHDGALDIRAAIDELNDKEIIR